MTPEEDPSKSEESAAPAKRPRARRSRRGGRGRGRKPDQVRAQSAPEERLVGSQTEEDLSAPGVAEPPPEEAPIPDSAIEEARREAAEASVAEMREEPPFEQRSAPPRPERRDFRPAAPAAIGEAIAEVNHVIASLRRVLDEMEEILETLELAEVQKTADEREIQSLRNALQQLERRGGSEPRHETQGGQHGPQTQARDRRHHRRR